MYMRVYENNKNYFDWNLENFNYSKILKMKVT